MIIRYMNIRYRWVSSFVLGLLLAIPTHAQITSGQTLFPVRVAQDDDQNKPPPDDSGDKAEIDVLKGTATLFEKGVQSIARRKILLSHVYSGIKQAPNYPVGFRLAQDGLKKVTIRNKPLLAKLREIELGNWKKVYQDGYDRYGSKISIHYDQSESGKVFDVEVKHIWSKL